uniref:Uncharacterized protein n=1 Tax=Pipistrellus kuhlii TaxID=59472 RepID=A0A7J7TW90_PIPKU|nr:hypothetical protein mPipKuh1_009284 [Pipistrellus kuhlii]
MRPRGGEAARVTLEAALEPELRPPAPLPAPSGAFLGTGARRRVVVQPRFPEVSGACVPAGGAHLWSWEGCRGAGQPLNLQRDRVPHSHPGGGELLEPPGGGCRAGSSRPSSRPQAPTLCCFPVLCAPGRACAVLTAAGPVGSPVCIPPADGSVSGCARCSWAARVPWQFSGPVVGKLIGPPSQISTGRRLKLLLRATFLKLKPLLTPLLQNRLAQAVVF